MTADQIIHLSDTPPIGAGSSHFVFEHPDDPDGLIKLPQPIISTLKFRFYERRHRVTAQRALDRQNLISGRVPVALYRGRVETDLGPGYVVERINDGVGNLAQTCEQYRHAGKLEPAILAALNTYVEKMLTLGIVCGDITLKNLAIRTEADGYEIIQVDGLGDRVIPLRAWVPSVNRLRTHRRFDRIAKNIGLVWNGRMFSQRPTQ
ncbi:MAG: hypothetical protein GKR99_17635 [Rhodobacteraceae bacterium]|nr:hypothetical protein [Paracoccaceae bacterium]